MDDSERFLPRFSELKRKVKEQEVLPKMLPKIEEQRNLAMYLFELESRIEKLEDEIRKLRTE